MKLKKINKSVDSYLPGGGLDILLVEIEVHWPRDRLSRVFVWRDRFRPSSYASGAGAATSASSTKPIRIRS